MSIRPWLDGGFHPRLTMIRQGLIHPPRLTSSGSLKIQIPKAESHMSLGLFLHPQSLFSGTRLNAFGKTDQAVYSAEGSGRSIQGLSGRG
jgi:hypothetical protein